ncbi:MAG: hypothetical protein ACPGGK_13045 [Pikeienuella sp.]
MLNVLVTIAFTLTNPAGETHSVERTLAGIKDPVGRCNHFMTIGADEQPQYYPGFDTVKSKSCTVNFEK